MKWNVRVRMIVRIAVLTCLPGFPALAADSPPPHITAPELFSYRFELGDRSFRDVVSLQNGAKHSGKVLEWADQILIADGGGRLRAVPVQDVDSFDLRRLERHNARFEQPDLTIAYVERLPRDIAWHGRVELRDGLPTLTGDPGGPGWGLKAGEQVTYRAHILNAGGADSAAAPVRATIDGAPLGEPANIPPLKPGAEHVVEFKWNWQDGQHELRVVVDVPPAAPDALRWNNTLVQPTRGLGVAFVVARDRYESFKTIPNMVDSFCFEDFAQYHIRVMNALLAASVYPSSPKGIEERLYCDRIIVVDDPADPQKHGEWSQALHRGGKADGLAEYAALAVFGKLPAKPELTRENAMVHWSLLKDLGAQIGLADLTKNETTIEQCYVLDTYERFAMVRYLSPFRASLMHTPGGFPLTEEQAGHLNHAIGRPRGFRGDYHFQLPAKISLKILAGDGRPLAGAQLDVFQLMADGPDAGRITGIGRTDPIISGITGGDGLVELPNVETTTHQTPGGYELKANPFGKIACDGSNGLLLLRLRSGRINEEFHFLSLAECNVAFLRGDKDHYIHTLATRFGSPAATLPQPPFAAVEMWERRRTPPPLVLTWLVPKGVDPQTIEEFRVYKRSGFAGQQVKPWTLVSVHRPPERKNFPHGIESYFDEFKYDGPYSLDTYFAVSTVDSGGVESGLSEPGYVPYEKEALRFAVDRTHAFMTARGKGEAHMLYWDGRAGTQPHQMKYNAVPGYKPAFEGIAFAPDGRLVVTDPVNHVLAFYDAKQSELVEVFPRRDSWPGTPGMEPGEFNAPADIAIDGAGTMYVADKNNHRVQILGPRGEPKGIVDPDFRFRSPTAVGFSVGYLSVTDKNGTRCRVYSLAGAEPKFLLELPPLVDADRAIVNPKGRIYITGRQSMQSDWTLLTFDPDGAGSATYSGLGLQGEMGSYERPRSLYQHRGDPKYVYMMNEFPFDVRRVHIEQE